MYRSDAQSTFPGKGPGRQENVMTMREMTTAGEAEERIAALEKRVRDMDALVRGLVAEMLDLKTVSMTLARQAGRSHEPEPGQGAVRSGPPARPSDSVSSGSDTVQPAAAGRPDVPDAPAEPEMVRIMQANGTMKMEPRYGNKKTI
jgi:uncharacterized membrane protein